MKMLFKKYLKQNLFILIICLLLGLGFVFLQLYIPILIGKTIDLISVENSLNDIVNNLFIMCFCVIGVFVFQYLYEFLINLFTQNVIKKLREDVYKKYNYAPVSYVDSNFKGDLLLRDVNDIENISVGLIGGFKQLFQGIIMILFTLGFMFYVNWFLALLIVIITPLSIFTSSFIAKKCSKYFKKQASSAANLSSISFENLKNYEVTKQYNFENTQIKKFNEENKILYKAGQKAQFYSSWINPTTRFINNLTYGVILIVGMCLIIDKNFLNYLGFAAFSIGSLQSLLVYVNQYSKPFNEISSVLTEIQNAFASLERVNKVLEQENEIDEGKNEVNCIDNLDFKNVEFSYDGNHIIINNISFNLLKGQRIAIIGPTGCGKTTLINLLLRYYEIQKGNIDINGTNINELSKDSLRNNFALVLQDSWLFKGTILENIKYGKQDATLDEVIEASKKAHCHNFISRLSDGYNTIIDQNTGLSSGEKQLICIARIILMNPEFVILDEATSNVDTRTEMKISKAFDNLLLNKTSIVIAHRLSTIVNSDLIIVLDKGQIIESGKHQELLDKKGFYYTLYNSQFEN